jgi:hypothetical protein
MGEDGGQATPAHSHRKRLPSYSSPLVSSRNTPPSYAFTGIVLPTYGSSNSETAAVTWASAAAGESPWAVNSSHPADSTPKSRRSQPGACTVMLGAPPPSTHSWTPAKAAGGSTSAARGRAVAKVCSAVRLTFAPGEESQVQRTSGSGDALTAGLPVRLLP